MKSVRHIFKNRSLPKQYVYWKIAATTCLCAGFIFLLETLTRIEVVSLSGLGLTNLSLLISMICLFAVLCTNRAQKNHYTTSGLRWTITSIVLLAIGLTLRFEMIASVSSDILGVFNFYMLAIMSSLICSASLMCEHFAQKFEIKTNGELIHKSTK